MIGQKIFLTMTQKCEKCPKIRKIRKIVKNRKNDAFLRPNIGQKVEKITKIWPKSRKNAKISLIIPLETVFKAKFDHFRLDSPLVVTPGSC